MTLNYFKLGIKIIIKLVQTKNWNDYEIICMNETTPLQWNSISLPNQCFWFLVLKLCFSIEILIYDSFITVDNFAS